MRVGCVWYRGVRKCVCLMWHVRVALLHTSHKRLCSTILCHTSMCTSGVMLLLNKKGLHGMPPMSYILPESPCTVYSVAEDLAVLFMQGSCTVGLASVRLLVVLGSVSQCALVSSSGFCRPVCAC
ncbi:hypothetical protein DUNSADRAFT_14437 [Dunaliella salina]|uniref:Encoded protein n=1 Tax=Dunaliella salina TaxID=3046 RepID=A0ABQ7H9J4_DUNSA|nr:hypothetical protein DUNSADRAFT_14437 [Dunaliella salina]|eukprot:KAF5843521.1 hypothetical protein DUNSADRAFT_14437 [Dunaliella salina]